MAGGPEAAAEDADETGEESGGTAVISLVSPASSAERRSGACGGGVCGASGARAAAVSGVALVGAGGCATMGAVASTPCVQALGDGGTMGAVVSSRGVA